MKGKPWSLEDEKKLRDWVNSGIGVETLVFSFEGRYSKDAILKKIDRLGLKVVGVAKFALTTTSKLELSAELPSVEETLKVLSATLEALKVPGLDKAEVLRLRSVIAGCKTYKELLADYMDYRGLEAELFELRQKYGELAKRAKAPC